MSTFGRQDVGRAVRQLKLNHPDDVHRLNKAYLYLDSCLWQFDSTTLVIESATQTGRVKYRVVNGICECAGWIGHSRCWHSDAWTILTAAQGVARPRQTQEEIEAAVLELFN